MEKVIKSYTSMKLYKRGVAEHECRKAPKEKQTQKVRE